MIFNSLTFLIFFLIFFNLYWLINNKLPVKTRNIFIIISSYIFYGWWDWRFLGLIFISSLSDYIIGFYLEKTENRKIRNLLLFSSVTINLGILCFFKYFNFFISSFVDMFYLFSVDIEIKTLNLILPVGISFYTFQTLSYTIDIYKRKLYATHDIFSFFAFVAFFPQLVAGPIERAGRLLSQFHDKKIFSYKKCITGLRLILWGIFKKVVFADNFGIIVDIIYDTSTPVTGLTTLIGTLFFAFQIYFDFSGYSDMAVGLARMLDINLMKNFNTPYFSSSLSEFWHRWHISLSTWFRDYLYIPLGGNRCKKFRNNFNIFITFLVSGLWHGANLTFLIWGSLHGIALIIEKKIHIKNKLLAIPVIFIMVTILYIPFRAENTEHCIALIKSLFLIKSYSFNFIFSIINEFSATKFSLLSLVLISFLTIEYQFKNLDFNEWISGKTKLFRMGLYYVLVVLFLLLCNFNVKPDFIYFQF